MLVRHLIRSKPLIAAGFLVATLLAAGAAVALVGGGPSEPRPGTPAPNPSSTPNEPPKAGEIAQTSSPEKFVVSVATTLFAWDTGDPTSLDDYTNRVLAVADPTGEETAGLVTDLTTYLPSAESWVDLKTYRTRQWLDINSYAVPGEWQEAEFNGETTDLAPGTVAYTITGLRRRAGILQGKPAQTVDQVSFTMFIICKPTYDTCRLLRLSQLNNPLH